MSVDPTTRRPRSVRAALAACFFLLPSVTASLSSCGGDEGAGFSPDRDPACQAAADEACCGQQVVCAKNDTCAATVACMNKCPTPRTPNCINACRSAANAQDGFDTLETCLSSTSVVAGSCSWPYEDCSEGQARCSSSCVDVQSDPLNCGGCNASCPTGAACVMGKCACPSGQEVCVDACIDTTSNDQHCGSCFNECDGKKSCKNGSCACPSGYTDCLGDCVNTQTDEEHCGSCSNYCFDNAVCNQGACDCAGPALYCGFACVDAATDVNNCGACANVCAPDEVCNAGTCGCAAGHVTCGGVCADLVERSRSLRRVHERVPPRAPEREADLRERRLRDSVRRLHDLRQPVLRVGGDAGHARHRKDVRARRGRPREVLGRRGLARRRDDQRQQDPGAG